MKVTINVTANFKKEAKPLFKRYPSLINDLAHLEGHLSVNPTFGIALGNNTYKIRLKISSKGKGKSGGARVITYLETLLMTKSKIGDLDIMVNLIPIYDKSETATITDKELKLLIAKVIGKN